MPNWCNNVIELSHEDPAMMQRAVEALNRGEFLQEFIPVPPELKATVAGSVGSNESYAQRLLEFTEKLNLEFFGYTNWYDFCVAEWGTKWDVGGDGITAEIFDGVVSTSFDSAWSPPVTAYEKLAEMGFSVRAYYYESGMGFAGVWHNGDDDFYELGGMDSVTVAEQLPTDLDEMFCISENMAEWEEENQEIDLDGGLSAVNEQEQAK